MFKRLLKAFAGDPPAPAPVPPPGVEERLAAGNEALGQGDLEGAERAYRAAITADAAHPLPRLNLGYVLLERGQPAAARDALEQALALRRPQDGFVHEAHFLLVRAHQALGQRDAALAHALQALQAQPAFEPALEAAVPLLIERKRGEEALRHARAAGDGITASMLQAQALHALGHADEALAALDQVLAREPAHAGALESRGNLLLERDEGEAGMACFRRLREVAGDTPEVLCNLSSGLLQLGRPAEALDVVEHGLRLFPDEPDLHYNQGLAQLLLERLPEGWHGYEWRWRSRAFGRRGAPRPTDRPSWSGHESLAGRSILLCAEQGLGDTIQFLRYVPRVAEQARQVLVQVQAPLHPLVRLPAGCRLLAPGEAPPATDFQCSLLSLPAALGSTFADLPAPACIDVAPQRIAAWKDKLPADGLPRVGIVCSGNADHKNDRHRSIPLALWSGLADLPCRFVLLQPELRPADRPALAAWPSLWHAGAEFAGFDDTAALLQSLDLVLTVDTSVAHLAGSLGRPTWVLLPFNPDWRWGTGRADTPWYASVRLVRQARPHGWPAVLSALRQDLSAWCEARAAVSAR